MSDHDESAEVTPYGPLRLYGLSSRGLHRVGIRRAKEDRWSDDPSWQLVREFDPMTLARVQAAAARMNPDRAGYTLWLLDRSVRTARDQRSERWAWELIIESEGTPIESTFHQQHRRRK